MDRFVGTSANGVAERAIAAGRRAFGQNWTADRLAIAPGRIELLGNHIDYNGGPVLAAAIDRFIAIASSRGTASGADVRAVSADMPDQSTVEFETSQLADWRNPAPPPDWTDYIRGMLAALQEPSRAAIWQDARLPRSLSFAGNVPIGFGVSSSAALCVALAMTLTEGQESSEEIVLLAQEAEHRAGTPCGTMDQSASLAGGVIAFDGATLQVERLAPALDDLVFAVADSGVERSLSTSSYPTRVAESQQALELARQGLRVEVSNLAALTRQQLETLNQRRILPEHLSKRVQHVVDETARVHEGRAAMTAGDWATFGRLMTASGRSSATLYEISHPEVEALVSAALEVPGILGARMMGGGEGGTALILLPRSTAPQLERALHDRVYGPRGMAGGRERIHLCAFAPGARVMAIAGSGLDTSA